MEAKNPIEQLLDPNNNENVTLYDENDKPVEFEQIALIPLNNSVYTILVPVEKVEGVDENSGLVFELVEDEENGDQLELVSEDEVVNQVFDEYERMLKADEENDKKKK